MRIMKPSLLLKRWLLLFPATVLLWAVGNAGAEMDTGFSGPVPEIERDASGRIVSVGARHIVLVNLSGAAEPVWFDATRAILRDQLGVPIKVTSDDLRPDEHPLYAAQRISARRTPDAVAMVLLWPGRKGQPAAPLITAPDEMWALIDVRWGADPAVPKRVQDDRLAKQLVRAIGFLFDVPYTVDPRAIMRRIQAPEDLDRLSISFFPPNQAHFERNARLLGMRDLLSLSPAERQVLDGAKHSGAPPAAGGGADPRLAP